MSTTQLEATLRHSKHLHIMERPGDTHIAYHKLFGNLTFLNDQALVLLKAFEQPLSMSDVSTYYAPYLEQINYFHNLYFLSSDDTDERDQLQTDMQCRSDELQHGKFLTGLQLCISESCNFKCTYCFCDSADERGEKRIELSHATGGETMMSFETAVETMDKLIGHVKETGGNSLSVRFFGREPLTNWKVAERVLRHYGNGSKDGVWLQYSITTNGSLITDQIAATIAEFNIHTTVSIDGLEQDANVNRLTIIGQNSTFAAAKRGIAILARHRPVDVVSAVMTEQSFPYFDKRFIEFAHRHGAKEVQILLGMQGDFIKQIQPDRIVQKLLDMHLTGRQAGIAVTGYWYNAFPVAFHTRKLRTDAHVVRGVGNSCSATGHQISVEPSGDIFPCRAMSTHLGHISALDEMLRSRTYSNLIMRTYNNVEDCKGCAIEGFCQGECPGHSEKKTGDLYQIDHSFCDVYRGIHKALLDTWQTQSSGQSPDYWYQAPPAETRGCSSSS